jgi:hypothetical protein
MLPYWLMFLGPAYLALSCQLQNSKKPINQLEKQVPVIWQVIFLILTLMIGFRHEVGGDWSVYVREVEQFRGVLFTETILSKDPANSALIWLGAKLGVGVYLGNVVCAIFFVSGLLVFCRSQPQPFLALVVAVPYLVTVVAMGYTRQGAAIGIVMLALVALSNGNTVRFVIWIGLAACFHNSAVILVPLAVLASTKRFLLTMLWVSLTSFTLFTLLLQEYVDFLVRGYLLAEYHSSGAAIRIAMNAVPAAIFLIFRKRFSLSLQQQAFWTWMAWVALLFVLLLIASPSSTAVDRVALYLIPLQLFVGSRLPQALGTRAATQRQWLLLVLVYAFTVHFVWLFYADNNIYWLPYKFYPWEWLWS